MHYGNQGSRRYNHESNDIRISEVTTMLAFQEQVLKHALDRLPPRSRVAFAASCAQRLTDVCHRFLARGAGGTIERALVTPR